MLNSCTLQIIFLYWCPHLSSLVSSVITNTNKSFLFVDNKKEQSLEARLLILNVTPSPFFQYLWTIAPVKHGVS